LFSIEAQALPVGIGQLDLAGFATVSARSGR